ncbi:MAG TPA: hypothetical protein PK971_16770, partial [Saprospiraceae bacterium]|nr:hypothetical protein [Saprospiraceae bacterium]
TASAQAVDGDKNHNWLLEGQALLTLENEINLWATQQQQGLHGVPGSPAWNNADNHIHYYKAIMKGIEDGLKVYEAVGEGLPMIAGDVTPQGFAVSPNLNALAQLKQDAIDLLTL